MNSTSLFDDVSWLLFLSYLPQFLLLSAPLWSLLIFLSLQSFCLFYLTCQWAQKIPLSTCKLRFRASSQVPLWTDPSTECLVSRSAGSFRHMVTRFPWTMPWISGPSVHSPAQPHLLRLLPRPENPGLLVQANSMHDSRKLERNVVFQKEKKKKSKVPREDRARETVIEGTAGERCWGHVTHCYLVWELLSFTRLVEKHWILCSIE